MARDLRADTIRMTSDEARKQARAEVDRVLATTDEEIDRQIAEDPDTAPDVTTLGRPLPDLRRIRAQLGMTQEALAGALGIPIGTIRNWEQRRTIPDPAGMALLRIIADAPDAAFKALGVKPVRKARSGRRVAA